MASGGPSPARTVPGAAGATRVAAAILRSGSAKPFITAHLAVGDAAIFLAGAAEALVANRLPSAASANRVIRIVPSRKRRRSADRRVAALMAENVTKRYTE